MMTNIEVNMRDEDHPSQRALEMISFDPITIHDGQVAHHVEGCVRCASLVAEMREGRREFALTHPRANYLAKARAGAARPRNWSLLFKAGPIVAFAIAALFALRFLPNAREHDGIKLKGGPVAIELYLSHGGAPARRFTADQAAVEGDQLKIAVDTARGRYIAVAGIDQRGRISRWFESRVHADRLLPGSIVLDEYVGLERVFAFSSEAPLSWEEIESALTRELERAGGRIDAMSEKQFPVPAASQFLRKVER
jgi:hypothetical protein